MDDQSFAVNLRFTSYANRKGYNIIGPIVGSDQTQLSRIIEFRRERYRNRRDYLYAPEQLEVDNRLQLDARSQHFVAMSAGRIVGSVRLTPAPFEFAALAPSLAAEAPPLVRHMELSRLAVEATAGRQMITSSLVVAASHWALADGSEGLVAICRGASRIIFERYGLRSTSHLPHFINWRGTDPYTLLTGSWPDLVCKAQAISDKLISHNTKNGIIA